MFVRILKRPGTRCSCDESCLQVIIRSSWSIFGTQFRNTYYEASYEFNPRYKTKSINKASFLLQYGTVQKCSTSLSGVKIKSSEVFENECFTGGLLQGASRSSRRPVSRSTSMHRRVEGCPRAV